MQKLPLTVGDGFVLDSLRDEDAESLVRCLADGEVASFIPVIPQPYDVPQARSWIEHRRAFLEKHGREVSFAVRNPIGELVGSMGFDDFPVGTAHQAEFGGWLAPAFRERRLGQRCGFAIARYGFDTLELRRITAHALIENERSARWLRHLGFVQQGLRRGHVRHDGQPRDIVAFALLPDDLALVDA